MRRLLFAATFCGLALSAAGCGSGNGFLDATGGGPDAAGGGDAATVVPIELPPFAPPEKNAVIGQAVNLEGLPVEGVTVSAGAITATTNYDGFYALADVAPAERIVVRFAHPGYAETTRTATMFADGRVVANAVLVRRQAAAKLDAAAGGTVAVPGGTVAFPAAAIVDESGAPAAGEVRLQVTPIDVAGAAIEAAPGDFSATTAAGTTGQLETFAMAEYRLTDAAGAPLQIKPGERATLEMLLPADTALQVGETLPAWRFDEATGHWVEEGSGTVQVAESDPSRLAFVADVAHFSTWNCDRTFEVTCVSGRVLRCDGTPAAGADLLAAGTDYDGASRAFAGSDGSFCVDVRRNSTVQLAAALGYGASRLVAVTTVTTPDTNTPCPGPCQVVDITLPCTPQESAVDCGDTYFAGCKSCVKGRVVDGSGNPVAAVVKVTSGRTTLTAVSDANGAYCAPAADGTLATIVASARTGEGGMVTVTPNGPGTCPDCTEAPDIVVDVTASDSDDELDFSGCPTTLGGLSLDPVLADGAAPPLTTLTAGWLLATRTAVAGEPTTYNLAFHFMAPGAAAISGAPAATAYLRLESAPTAARSFTLDNLAEGEDLSGDALSAVGAMTGLANETYDLVADGGRAHAEIQLEAGFANAGDPVRGQFRFTYGPECAPANASLTLSGRFDTVLRDAQGFMPSVYDPEAPEYQAWLCGFYDLFVWAKSVASFWEGAIQVYVDGAAVVSESEPYATARYSFDNDQLSLSYYGGDTNVSATVDRPVSGTNEVTNGSLMFNGSDCYYEVASGTVVLADFGGGTSDTWFTGSLDVQYTKASYAQGDCPDHTVTGQFGAAVCR